MSGVDPATNKLGEERAKELIDFVACIPTTAEDLEPYLGMPRVGTSGVLCYPLEDSQTLFLYTDSLRFGGLIVGGELALLAARHPDGIAIREEYQMLYSRKFLTASNLKD